MKHWSQQMSATVNPLMGRQAGTLCLGLRKWSIISFEISSILIELFIEKINY